MKARMLVAILAAFMAVTFTPYHANADGQCQSGVLQIGIVTEHATVSTG